MLKISNYIKAKTIEEAWELNQKPGSRILGGMMWLRLGGRNIETAIDLVGLGLDEISESPEEFSIGAMTGLQKLMEHEGFVNYTNGAVTSALKPIVGVQFRNMATVGGSIFARLGFSDVLTLFMALDADVVLHKAGRMPLREFAEMKPDNDILTHVIVRKEPGRCYYRSVRKTSTDFPVLACAARKTGNGILMAFGGRPERAMIVSDPAAVAEGRETIRTGGNMRGSSEYRNHLVKTLAADALKVLGGDENDN